MTCFMFTHRGIDPAHSQRRCDVSVVTTFFLFNHEDIILINRADIVPAPSQRRSPLAVVMTFLLFDHKDIIIYQS